MALQHLSGQLAAVQPFDFAKSLAFIGAFPPVRGEQTQGDLTLTKGVMVAGQPRRRFEPLPVGDGGSGDDDDDVGDDGGAG